ncbi:hypothetical protein ABZ499_27435 [Streptomyces sp. NPDC019990]|uniref:hypothetical protein n=1 Tax=Streptomyces sp. NPDC019990 TaxID=3154693 RepID=UPI0033F6F255
MTTTRKFLAEWFEDAYQDATQHRRKLLDRGLFYIACLIREELPAATAITVNSGILTAVHGAEGTIWRFNDETSGKLSDRDRATIRDTLLDVRCFTTTNGPLEEAGWKPEGDLPEVFRIDLPDTGQDDTPTA